mgnify:CR=1 FL=1
MAVSMADITKLRKMTGAGMMDCKNALNDAEGELSVRKDRLLLPSVQTARLLKVAFWLRLPVTLPLSSL